MKKIILGLLSLVAIVIAVGVYYVLTNLDALVKQAIETHGSEATQTAVRVDKVNIDLANGAAGLSGLTIANPTGYDLPGAFSLGEIRAGIDLGSLQEEPYIINEITVLAPQVFVEINENNTTNLSDLKNNLMAGAPSKPKTEAPTSDQGSAPGPRLIIRRVTFADGSILARAAIMNNQEFTLKLPSLDMSDLGGASGATTDELAKEILLRLTGLASLEVKAKIIDQEIAKYKARAQEMVDEETAKLKAKADAEKEKQMQNAEDKFKGMFGQ